MPTEAADVLHRALALPAAARLPLADALLSSLNASGSPAIDQAWQEEAERSGAEIDSGQAPLVDGEGACLRLGQKLRR